MVAIYGLLVGVNQYQSPMVNTLRGCENDVYLFAQTLQVRFGIPDGHLTVLLNTKATHQNIIDHFQRCLIERDWQPDDKAVFYFSGHGAQSLAPEIFWDIEPDHLNESLVCHDSRTPGVPDLLDKELRYLIAQLAKKCGHIAAFLDCCHSGYGTRNLRDDEETVRFAPLDIAEYPLECFVFGQQRGKTLGQLDPCTLLPDSGKHVLLSGCHSFQLSREKPQGEAYMQHGLFTYALCETLASLQYPISYQELRNRIHTRVQAQNAAQSPQIEAVGGANVTQSVLGGELLPLRLLAYREKGQWKLNAGVMHGLDTGDEVALFGNDADTSKLATCLTQARIQQADSFTSTLALGDIANTNGSEYTAIVTRQHFSKLPVRLLGDAAGVQAARDILQQDASPADPGRFLREAAGEPRYDIHAGDGVYYVTQAHDLRPLFKRSPHVAEVLAQAAAMARWHQKRDLHNPASKLDDPVEIVVTYDGQEYINQDVTLSYSFDADNWVQPRFNLELRLKPGQPKLYYALLYFDGSTGEISNVLASGYWLNHEGNINTFGARVVMGEPIVKVLGGQSIALKIRDELLQQGITCIQDSLKLIVCEEGFDSYLLEQSGLELDDRKVIHRIMSRNALNRLLNDAHRSLALETEVVVDTAPDWTSKLINLSVTRPPSAMSVSGLQTVTLLQTDAGDVRIEPHPAFRGLARLTTAQRENTRSAETSVIREPAVLSASASVFAFSEGRGGDLGLDALEISFGTGAAKGVGSSADAVSVDNPLIISTTLPLEAGADILPYTYDQENQVFLPLGFSRIGEDGRTAIVIETLPEAALAIPQNNDRSIGSALKIYFRKLVYRDLLRIDEQVHALRVFDLQADGREPLLASPAAITGKQRILLLIHGIIGQTSGMVACLDLIHSEGQSPLASQYDLILTFDYENLNTRIQDIAKVLKDQLEQAGITPDSGKRIDILAHSMGGLVSRWFIEREGGDQIVNTLVMVGTPNGGSPLASFKEYGYAMLKTWAYSNLVVILNGLTTVAVGGVVVAALMKLLDAVDNTLDQLAPDSDLIHELANSSAPTNVRYRVVAGDTNGQMIAPGRHTARLGALLTYLGQRTKLAAYDLLTEKLFKEANDMAVGHGSMVQFNPAWQAAVAVEPVQCDHLSYFADPAAVRKIAQQLSL